VEFRGEVKRQETRVKVATLWWRLHDPNINRLWLIHPCDRQTDRRTDGRWHIARYSRCCRALKRNRRKLYSPNVGFCIRGVAVITMLWISRSRYSTASLTCWKTWVVGYVKYIVSIVEAQIIICSLSFKQRELILLIIITSIDLMYLCDCGLSDEKFEMVHRLSVSLCP